MYYIVMLSTHLDGKYHIISSLVYAPCPNFAQQVVFVLLALTNICLLFISYAIGP